MRISTRKDDPGYTARAYNYQVYLDGKKLDHCHTADEEKGEAHCFVYDDDDRPVWALGSTGLIETEIKYGDVRVEMMNNYSNEKIETISSSRLFKLRQFISNYVAPFFIISAFGIISGVCAIAIDRLINA